MSSASSSDIVNLSNGILLFYVAIAANFTQDLYSRQLREFIRNHRIMHHIIGYIILLYTISYTTDRAEWINIYAFTALVYLWFILTTKMDVIFTILTVLCLAIGFTLNTHLASHKSADNKEILQLRQYERYSIYVAIGITVIGFVKFLFDRYQRPGFSISKLLFYD